MKAVFIEPERCIGCRQCEYACAVEHSRSKDPFLAVFEDPPPRTRIHVDAGPTPGTSFPGRCHHCDPAPCVQVCPTGAMYRDADLELVLVDETRCIACAMCAMVCPFDVITFHPARVDGEERVVSTKCDGCRARVVAGGEPACVEVCKVGALRYGDRNDLVRERRVHTAAAALAAAAAPGDGHEETAPVAAWREFGRELSLIRGGAR